MKIACEDCTNLMIFMIRGMRLKNGGVKEPKNSPSRKKKVPAARRETVLPVNLVLLSIDCL